MTSLVQRDFASHLNGSDTLMWTIEKDPCLRSTIVAVSLLDRSPDWKRLSSRIADACEVLPRLRQRVVVTPFHLEPPRWQIDEYFDISYHLRRTVAPEQGDLRAVMDIAGLMAMSAFDKDRPLWEFTLVEGLEDGRAAFIQKVHHSITDGVGGVKLARLLLDERRDAPPLATNARSTIRDDRADGHRSPGRWRPMFAPSRRRRSVAHRRFRLLPAGPSRIPAVQRPQSLGRCDPSPS